VAFRACKKSNSRPSVVQVGTLVELGGGAMVLGTIQKVSPEGVLTIWSADLRSYTFAAKWHANLPRLIGSEVEFELPAGREITRIRLTRPNIVHRVLLEPAPAAGAADPAHRKRRGC
jgi:hypothetical protein